MIAHWGVDAVYRSSGRIVGRRRLRVRRFTRAAAAREASRLECNPTVLAMSVEAMIQGKSLIVDCVAVDLRAPVSGTAEGGTER